MESDQTEAQIQSEIMAFLERVPQAHFYRTSPSRGGRGHHRSEIGQPDITGCYKGQFWAFEVKARKGVMIRKGVQSEKQMEFQANIEKAWGKYFLVRSLDEVIKIFEEVSG